MVRRLPDRKGNLLDEIGRLTGKTSRLPGSFRMLPDWASMNLLSWIKRLLS